MTRREMLVGLGGILATGTCPAVLNNVPLCRVGKFAPSNPYVTDGLVAMWDGEWNAGIGVHDSEATSWVDCIVGKKLVSQGGHSWGNKALYVNEQWCWENLNNLVDIQSLSPYFDGPKTEGGGNTIEIVLNAEATGSKNIFGDRYTNVNIFTNNGKVCAWLGNGNNTVSNLPVGVSGTASFVVSKDTAIINTSYSNGILSNSYQGRVYSGSNPMKKFGVGYGEYAAWGIASGDIYCIRMYSRALTASEIAANYAVDKARFNI